MVFLSRHALLGKPNGNQDRGEAIRRLGPAGGPGGYGQVRPAVAPTQQPANSSRVDALKGMLAGTGGLTASTKMQHGALDGAPTGGPTNGGGRMGATRVIGTSTQSRAAQAAQNDATRQVAEQAQHDAAKAAALQAAKAEARARAIAAFNEANPSAPVDTGAQDPDLSQQFADEREAMDQKLADAEAKAIMAARARAGVAGLGLSGGAIAAEGDLRSQLARDRTLALAELARSQRSEGREDAQLQRRLDLLDQQLKNGELSLADHQLATADAYNEFGVEPPPELGLPEVSSPGDDIESQRAADVVDEILAAAPPTRDLDTGFQSDDTPPGQNPYNPYVITKQQAEALKKAGAIKQVISVINEDNDSKFAFVMIDARGNHYMVGDGTDLSVVQGWGGGVQ